MMITAERLRYLVRYEPETGNFIRLVQTSSRPKVGEICGTVNAMGYWQICLDGKLYLSHRLAVLWMTGRWPEHQVDHKDGTRSNNKWENLREATSSENHANYPVLKSNTSGLKGVYWSGQGRKWAAMITKDGKGRHLGLFDCPAAAHLAYIVAADITFGEFVRLR